LQTVVDALIESMRLLYQADLAWFADAERNGDFLRSLAHPAWHMRICGNSRT
jgi:hypothetical protein